MNILNVQKVISQFAVLGHARENTTFSIPPRSAPAAAVISFCCRQYLSTAVNWRSHSLQGRGQKFWLETQKSSRKTNGSSI